MYRFSVCLFKEKDSALFDEAVSSVCEFADEIVTMDSPTPQQLYKNGFSFYRNALLGMASNDFCFVMDHDETIENPDIICSEVERLHIKPCMLVEFRNDGDLPNGKFYPHPRILDRTKSPFLWLAS